MASCITSQWVNASPQVKLIVELDGRTDTTEVFRYTLQYIASSAASTSVDKSYKITIDGAIVRTGTYDINGKTGTHTICTGTVSKARGNSARSMGFAVNFQFNLTWSGIYKGTMSASGYVTVSALPNYTITYHANGGTGAPASQTKRYGTSITLSSSNPSMVGHTFKGWSITKDGIVEYYPGGTYSTNASLYLYAVWKANTYTVSYNANGGTGAPASQTKTYGVNLKLSSTVPTRENYRFVRWRTSTGSQSYNPGATYTANTGTTLVAEWELIYVKPAIFSLTATRCDSDGELSETGSCVLVQFKVQTTYEEAILVDVEITSESDPGDSETLSFLNPVASGGTFRQILGGSLSADSSYKVKVSVTDCRYWMNYEDYDPAGTSEATVVLPSISFPIDIYKEGKGVSFGKAAELAGVADFGWDAKFNKPVYGKALGMDRLPAIPSGSDFNNYMDPGCYAVQSNAIAKTCKNAPCYFAGRLEVWSSTGEGIRLEAWSYLRQRFVSYSSQGGVWERDITRSSDNVWTYGEWWLSSLMPQNILWGDDMASGMYMTAEHTATLSSNVSEQPNGIILVFSAYESASDTNYGWECFFVPKLLVSLSTSGHTFILGRGKFTRVGTKYLYIYDDRIVGHADNNLSGTSNGIEYNNAKFVLRYVIGV